MKHSREAPAAPSADSPPRSTRTEYALAVSVSAISLTAYWMTHGSGPFWQDSGLFLAALKTGGGLLPPGYPIYLLLGRPFVWAFTTLLPARTFAEAGNMFSALWAALAAGFVSLTVFTLCSGVRFFGPPSARAVPPDRRSVLFSGWLAGLMTGLSYSLWFQALTAEAYALNAFFTSVILFLVFKLGQEGPLGATPTVRQRRLAYALLAIHGLSFGNHPVAVVYVPAILWLAWISRGAFRNRRFALTGAAILAACATVPYLYLPLAARAYPGTPYSGVSTASGFIAQMSGSQWSAQAQSYGFSAERLALVPGQIWNEMLVVGSVGLTLGLHALWQRHRRALFFLIVVLAPALLLPLVYLRGGEYDFWLLSAYVQMFVIAGAGIGSLVARLTAVRSSATAAMLAAALSALAVAPALTINAPLLDRRADFVPEDFGRNLLRHLDPGAVFIAMSDQENALTYYLDAVEGARPDVIRLDGGVLATPWFPDQLRHRYPAFEFEDISKGRASAPSTDEWIAALIRSSAGKHTVYMTSPPSVPVPDGMDWIPSGGLWKLVSQGASINRVDWDYTYRNPDPFNRTARDHAPEIAPDGSIRREPYTRQIHRFHVQAWKNLGDWSVAHEDYKEGASAYAKAIELDPGLDNARVFFGLGKSLFILDRPKEALAFLERVGERLDQSATVESSLYLFQIYEGADESVKAAAAFEKIRLLNPELALRIEAARRPPVLRRQ